MIIYVLFTIVILSAAKNLIKFECSKDSSVALLLQNDNLVFDWGSMKKSLCADKKRQRLV